MFCMQSIKEVLTFAASLSLTYEFKGYVISIFRMYPCTSNHVTDEHHHNKPFKVI